MQPAEGIEEMRGEVWLQAQLPPTPSRGAGKLTSNRGARRNRGTSGHPSVLALSGSAIICEVHEPLVMSTNHVKENALRPAHSQPARTQRATSHHCWLTLLP